MEKILKDLKDCAEKLNLNFDENWFGYVWETKEQEILTEYLSDCRDPIYEKYGHELPERVNNLEKFYKSKDYKECIKRFGGQVISAKNYLNGYRKFVETIKNKEIKKILLNFCDRIDGKIKDFDEIAVLTETNIEREKNILMNDVLRHEWIHMLLEQNNLRPKNWKYSEGLTTYIDFLIRNKLDILEECEKNATYDFQKEYFTNAILFGNLLKDVPDNKKIQKIKKFLENN